MTTLKVSAHSNTSALAGALAQEIENHNRADMQAIGAGALNQAVKAVAIARGFVAPRGQRFAPQAYAKTAAVFGSKLCPDIPGW